MLTTNIDIADRLMNGQMGTVIKIEVDGNTKKTNIVYIKFDDSEAGKDAIARHSNNFAYNNQVVPIIPVLTKIKIKPDKPSSPEIQRTQFPLTLAYACTIHKVQGLTLKNVVISFDLLKQPFFNYGQIYVALSRSTALQGLHILGNIEMKHIKANPKVDKEYERLREISSITSSLPSEQELAGSNAGVTVSLLNIRSLTKHSIDIKYDGNMFNSDILAFTETQLLPNDGDNEIRKNLQPFALFRQDHQRDKFMSLAVCTKDYIQITERKYFSSINALKFVITNFINHQNPSFLLLYRKHSTSIPLFISNLEHILNLNNIDVVLGDFNINYFNSDDYLSLKSLMNNFNFEQIVQQPTFISSGSLLDHIYVKCANLKILQNDFVNVYYSDHDAIKINMQKFTTTSDY